MPYVCRDCDHFDAEGAHASGCPQCGGGMRFTMLGQHATATATLEPPEHPEWKNPYAGGYEIIEAPVKYRYAQVALGVSIYLFVYRWAPRVLLLSAGPLEKLPPDKQFLYGIIVLAVDCIAATAGGFVAGFWARTWFLQGLGVVFGGLIYPLVMLYFATPKNMKMFAATLAAAGFCTLVGAFAGHMIVKPTRIPRY